MSTKSKKSVALDLYDFLDNIDNGSLSEELMTRLRDVVSRVRETGRKGNVKLQLNVQLAGANQVEIEPELKSKEPKTSHAQGIFYSDEEGHLYRQDPAQIDLPLRKPEGSDAETARSVNEN